MYRANRLGVSAPAYTDLSDYRISKTFVEVQPDQNILRASPKANAPVKCMIVIDSTSTSR